MSGIRVDSVALLKDLQELISINSVNPDLDENGPGEKDIAFYLEGLTRKMGFDVSLQDLGKNRYNLIAIRRGTGGGRTLLLNGHMDTVDVKNMTIAPFEPELRDGRVYGRGSLDMKGGIASILSASRAVANSGMTLKGDIILAFVADEEYKSIGTEAVAGKYGAHGAVICEPTDLQLVLAHKGFTWERLTFHGKAAHGSRSEEGVDAIMHAGQFLSALDGFHKNILMKRKHPLLGSPSVHASLITGGTGISTYPDRCILELERRTLPEETAEEVKDEISSLLVRLGEENPDLRVDHDQYFIRNPLEISDDDPLVKCLKNSWRNFTGTEVKIGGFSGWADSAILNDNGIPTVNFGPSGKGLHSAEEYVDLQSVVDCARVLTETIISYCSGEEAE